MRLKKNLYILLMAVLAVIMMITGSQSVSAQAAVPVTVTGRLSIIWGDGPAGTSTPQTIYTLTGSDGVKVRLLLDETSTLPQGGLTALNRQLVTVQGVQTQSLSAQGIQVTTMQVSSISLENSLGASANDVSSALVSGSQPFVSIMCKFAFDPSIDPPLPEPPAQNLSYFQGMYSSAYPGLDHYWREVSYNTANIAGSNAYGWYTLPRTRSDYFIPIYPYFDLDLAANDCTAAADQYVNFANFPGGINLMFNDLLDPYDHAWGGDSPLLTLDGLTNHQWPMTWEPPWGYQDITVIAHEMGHAFGLPHSLSFAYYEYGNMWDVMSDSWSNCPNSTDPTYGCLGQHTISYYKDLLGWIPNAQKITIGQNTNSIVMLEQLALPSTSNYRLVKIPISGSTTRFYTVEVRRKTGYDVKLPSNTVLIHEIDTTRSNYARIIDADGNYRNTTDHISASVVYSTATGFKVHVTTGQDVFYISGRLTLSGVGMTGATVAYTGNTSSGSTLTDSNGYYSIAVPDGWIGTVTPSMAGYTFTPLNRAYNNVASNFSNQNYTAVLNPTISGNVGAEGVTLSYTDVTAKTATSLADGSYSFQVSNGWTGDVTPTHPCFTLIRYLSIIVT